MERMTMSCSRSMTEPASSTPTPAASASWTCSLQTDAPTHKLLHAIGVEPLGNELHGDYLAEKFRGKAAPLKAALLDQQIIAGLGNIYVCEALHRAGLSPKRKSGTLVRKKAHDPRLDALIRHIREILAEAIAGRRLHAAGLRAHRWRIGSVPAALPRLRPRGRALHHMRGSHRKACAVRPFDLLLPPLPEVGRNMAYENIIVETRGHVGLVTLNRPKALNALNQKLIEELNEALGGFEADPAIGCTVITGSEKAFAAGADVKEMAEKTYVDAYVGKFLEGWSKLSEARKPVIAAVSGFCLGGGCELAMMCDFIIASDTAKFGLPEITLGIMPGAGGTQRLPRLIGKAKAMDMILTGRMMDAAEAERSGLVARVVAPDKLLDEALCCGGEDRFLFAGRS